MLLCIDADANANLGDTIVGLSPADFLFVVVSDCLPRTGLTMFLLGEQEAQPRAGAKMSLPGIG